MCLFFKSDIKIFEYCRHLVSRDSSTCITQRRRETHKHEEQEKIINGVRNGNENLKKEIRCIKLVKHTNVIKLFDTVDEEDSDKVYLIFELANLLSLQDLCELVREKGIKDPITEVENKWLPIPYIRILFEQLVQGLLACHSKASADRASRCPPPLSRKSVISLPCSG